ncbi:MAG: cytochrome c [Acidiferrobacterales bacterium]|nr:cytochrome c [Acidiferrobacterales bacterium]
MKLTTKLPMIVLLVSSMTGSIAHATEPPTVGSAEEVAAVLEARSEFMKGMGSAMKAFSNFLKRGDGEPLELGAMAAEIAENAPGIPDLFPTGTGMEQIEESESKPEIWEKWDDFVAAANDLVEPALALEMAFESGDKAKIGASVKALGGNGCRGCHTPFREKHEH